MYSSPVTMYEYVVLLVAGALITQLYGNKESFDAVFTQSL